MVAGEKPALGDWKMETFDKLLLLAFNQVFVEGADQLPVNEERLRYIVSIRVLLKRSAWQSTSRKGREAYITGTLLLLNKLLL